MKKVILIVLAISLVAAGAAFASVVGSLHDLGTGGADGDVAATGTGQVCVFCHHPHRGPVANLTTAILWNITDWDDTAFPVYDNTGNTMNAAPIGDVVNDGSANAYASYFCMACHDGTVSANALVRPPRDGSNTSAYTLDPVTNLGTTLEDDHPVNFVYAAASGPDNEIRDINHALNKTGLTTPTDYPLFNGDTTMQCATCHDVHRGGLNAGTCDVSDAYSCDPNIEFMLETTINSAICIDCHIK
jgi:hypothetical protein